MELAHALGPVHDEPLKPSLACGRVSPYGAHEEGPEPAVVSHDGESESRHACLLRGSRTKEGAERDGAERVSFHELGTPV